MLPLTDNLSFLDVGCGTGWAVRHAASLMNEHGQFYGIDISSRMIEEAQDRARDCRSVRFCTATSEALPFRNDLFDLIICTHSFHHYLHPAQTMEEMFRVLRSGGRVYILDVSADDVITRAVDRVVKEREPEHVKFYSTRDYRILFAGARLKHLATRSILPPLKVHIGEK
jgi:ubiquinone/menaquinone biosynthesis C-methylase UbiE